LAAAVIPSEPQAHADKGGIPDSNAGAAGLKQISILFSS
jgi:hypothetical protein